MNAQTQQASPAAERRNGVDVTALFATIDAVKADTGLAGFRFRTSNRDRKSVG